MSYLHALILIPYYFVTALALLPLLLVVSRCLRLEVTINTLVIAAIVLSVVGIALPLILDWVDLEAYSGRRLLVLVLASLGLSTVDMLLTPLLPLPLDEELKDT